MHIFHMVSSGFWSHLMFKKHGMRCMGWLHLWSSVPDWGRDTQALRVLVKVYLSVYVLKCMGEYNLQTWSCAYGRGDSSSVYVWSLRVSILGGHAWISTALQSYDLACICDIACVMLVFTTSICACACTDYTMVPLMKNSKVQDNCPCTLTCLPSLFDSFYHHRTMLGLNQQL